MLQHERQRLAGIIDGTNVGTWEWNVQSGETVFNERWAEIVGYRLSELMPVSIQTWAEFTHPDDLAASGQVLERHFRGELPYYECECRMKHRNGRWIWVLDRGKVTSRTADGKPLMVLGTHFDIDARKRAEQAQMLLAATGTFLHAATVESHVYERIAETARALSGAEFAALSLFGVEGESFTTVAIAGEAARVSEAIGALGFSPVGHNWGFHPHRAAIVAKQVLTVFPSTVDLPFAAEAPAGAVRLAEVCGLGAAVMVRIASQTQIIGFYTLFFARGRELENAPILEAYAAMVGIALERLRTAERNRLLVREKETLLREVQHRIKNNMNAMTSLLNLQAMSVANPAAEAALNAAQSRFRSMQILYDQLYHDDSHDSVLLNDYLPALVRQVVEIFPTVPQLRVTVAAKPMATEAGGAPAADLSPVCRVDGRRLSSVGLIINELVTNAMKYAFAGHGHNLPVGDSSSSPTLAVEAQWSHNRIEIAVTDNGPGTPAGFDPESSTGFGLTMVRLLVEQLEGTVRFESAAGMRVVFSFPRTKQR